MSTASKFTRVARRHGVTGHVCAMRDWHCIANFGGQGTVAGIKRQPQPTTRTYEGKAPDS